MAGKLATVDDPLSVPLADLNPKRLPGTLYKNILALFLFLLLLYFLPMAYRFLLPVVVDALPLLICATITWVGWLAFETPEQLRRYYKMVKGIPRDVGFVVRLVGATKQLKRRLHKTQGTFTTADYWAEMVKKHSTKEALVWGTNVYTYADIDRESNRVAQWAHAQGIVAGDALALCCANRPEHLFIWLGMAKVGAATTLINASLVGSSLEHALKQCAVHIILFDSTATGGLGALAQEQAMHSTTGNGRYRFVSIDPTPPPNFAELLILPEGDVTPVPDELRAGCRATDTLLHIFTSGTTGLPKAARLNHVRFFSAIVITYMFDMKSSDRLYCCLPMCHTAAVSASSICWWLGIPVVLAPRFSVRTFWKDCAEHRVTIIQYVGELCRYLVHSPPSNYDHAHSVRLAFGNGLRPDVWPRFKSRFGINTIAEVYASTEGNANLANTVGKQGAVGFISPLLSTMYPVRLAKLADDGNGDLRRDANGLCELCGPDEPGELLGLVNQRDASRNFAGYTDTSATRRKLVRNVEKRGDCWFRTGDLMRTDEDGFVFFLDRLGDTFRYKGENVSTAEVASVIGGLTEFRLQHCLVYGIALPNIDGRVGMSALVPEPEAPPVDMQALFDRLECHLPSFAHPRFIRLLDSPESIDSTITFKPKKAGLQAEGIEGGNVYIRDAEARTFVALDAETRRGILSGELVLESYTVCKD